MQAPQADQKPRLDSGLLAGLLEEAPSRRVLDLGCGDGRHARLLAEQGCQVVGIDASEAAIERARAHGVPEGVEFLLGEMGAVEGFVRGHFGLAICLGNTLSYLLNAESLSRMLVASWRFSWTPRAGRIVTSMRIWEVLPSIRRDRSSC
ncbi:MAG: class I SAM-dependent methyltransferase [Acidobacteriota bacterium]|nr:class I SAM-dependent methyltransferase [Acidobacteriota bacterium]